MQDSLASVASLCPSLLLFAGVLPSTLTAVCTLVYVELASLAQLLCRAAGSLTFPLAILLWQSRSHNPWRSCSDYSLAHTTPGGLAQITVLLTQPLAVLLRLQSCSHNPWRSCSDYSLAHTTPGGLAQITVLLTQPLAVLLCWYLLT